MNSLRWKTIIKNILLLWGAVSLALIIAVVAFLMITNMRQHGSDSQKPDEIIHEASFGDVKLRIVRKYDSKTRKLLLALTHKEKQIVNDYVLPTHDAGFDYIDIRDSRVMPYGNGKYRITLFSDSSDCDETSTQVWFLRYDGQMKLIRVEDLFDVRYLNSGKSSIVGSKHFYLPHTKGHEYKRFVMPVEINANETITIAPLLSDRGIRLIREDFEKDLAGRREALAKDADQSKQKRFEKVTQIFNETLRLNNIPW